MKLYVNRNFSSPKPYGGGLHFSNAIINHYKNEIVDDIRDADTALIVGINGEDDKLSGDDVALFKARQNHDLRLVLRVNDCDKRKTTNTVDRRIKAVASVSDHVVFVSEWMRDYFMFESKHSFVHKKHPNASVIVNGCDKDVFGPATRYEVLSESMNDKRTHIVYDSWSDNPMKGQDYIEWLDDFVGRNKDRFTFMFIGRTKAKLKNSVHIPPLCGMQLAKALAQNDLYLFFSKWDPAPNACIESLSLGIPTYVRIDSGGAVELAGSDHLFLDFDDLEKLLLRKYFAPNKTSVSTWNECIKKYDEVLRG